jgi:hypothetical protein
MLYLYIAYSFIADIIKVFYFSSNGSKQSKISYGGSMYSMAKENYKKTILSLLKKPTIKNLLNIVVSKNSHSIWHPQPHVYLKDLYTYRYHKNLARVFANLCRKHERLRDTYGIKHDIQLYHKNK